MDGDYQISRSIPAIEDHGPGITWHCPFWQPQCPAPQSIGPRHSRVQSSVHTSLYAALMQLVGWQHWAGTHSESFVQLVISLVRVGVGVPYPGPATQPARKMRAARRMIMITDHESFRIMGVNSR
jgi:hypothetical protein